MQHTGGFAPLRDLQHNPTTEQGSCQHGKLQLRVWAALNWFTNSPHLAKPGILIGSEISFFRATVGGEAALLRVCWKCKCNSFFFSYFLEFSALNSAL